MPELSLVKKAQTDPSLKRDGVWHNIPLPGSEEPLRLKLRALSSDRARAWENARWKKQRHLYASGGTLSLKEQDQNDIDRLAEVLVVEWDLTENGEPVPCTPDVIRAVMAQNPDTRTAATQAAGQAEAYRMAEVEALAGNSERPSSPTSDTAASAP